MDTAVVKTVHRLAWRYARMFDMDVEELHQHGMLHAQLALRTWDPKKGAKTTKVWKPVWTELWRYCLKQDAHLYVPVRELGKRPTARVDMESPGDALPPQDADPERAVDVKLLGARLRQVIASRRYSDALNEVLLEDASVRSVAKRHQLHQSTLAHAVANTKRAIMHDPHIRALKEGL